MVFGSVSTIQTYEKWKKTHSGQKVRTCFCTRNVASPPTTVGPRWKAGVSVWRRKSLSLTSPGPTSTPVSRRARSKCWREPKPSAPFCDHYWLPSVLFSAIVHCIFILCLGSFFSLCFSSLPRARPLHLSPYLPIYLSNSVSLSNVIRVSRHEYYTSVVPLGQLFDFLVVSAAFFAF